jgi:hypothetical protein
MEKSTKTLGVFAGLGLGLLTLGLVGAPSAANAQTRMSQEKHETVTVSAIDRAKRSVTLQEATGETKTVRVPEDVKSFNTLKVGDKIDIDYYESMALSLLPAGAKPSATESSSATRMGAGAGSGARTQTVSAEIVAVDTAANTITFKGPRGRAQTVTVSDPDLQRKLNDLKPGQVVQLTYTQAMAASIRPASGSSGSTKNQNEKQNQNQNQDQNPNEMPNQNPSQPHQ